jgi:hypothetical protein
MSWFSSSQTKLWKIGKHRVKKVKRKKEIGSVYPPATKKVTRYKCVDCERVLKNRESFESDDYTCYDVIQE